MLKGMPPGVQDAVEDAGARLLYLPSNSPEFNPIEQAFAKLKTAVAQHKRSHFSKLFPLLPKLFSGTHVPDPHI